MFTTTISFCASRAASYVPRVSRPCTKLVKLGSLLRARRQRPLAYDLRSAICASRCVRASSLMKALEVTPEALGFGSITFYK